MKLIDKSALVAKIEKLQSEIAEEKKLHEDNSMWYNGINHGFNLTKDILNTLEVKYLQEEPVSIDFEQELYKAFGQVKDFTLGMRIAKWFYDMGKNSQEPVSEDLKLFWEDISILRQIMFDYNRQVRDEMSIPNNEDYCKEVLKRFRDYGKKKTCRIK